MTLEIVPFVDAHREGAMRLLANRHQLLRRQEPALPERFDEAVAWIEELEKVVGEAQRPGVVALRAGQVIGFLLPTPTEVPRESPYSPFVRDHAAEFSLAGHAVTDGGAERYRHLYAALAGDLARDGCRCHYVAIPGHDQSGLETWFELGFGQFANLAVRELSDPTTLRSLPRATFRRATHEDRSIVDELSTGVLSAFSESPNLLPSLPEAFDATRDLCRQALADPECAIWLAFRDGYAQSYQLYVTPTSPLWFISPQESPDHGLYLFMAYTRPEARGLGLQSHLLHASMEWASSAGYRYCTLHYLPPTPAAIYWRNLGFRTLHYQLYRQLDDRLA